MNTCVSPSPESLPCLPDSGSRFSHLPPELLIEIASYIPSETDRECLRIAHSRFRSLIALRPSRVSWREFHERVLPCLNAIAEEERPGKYGRYEDRKVPKYFLCYNCNQVRVVETEWATSNEMRNYPVRTHWYCIQCFPEWSQGPNGKAGIFEQHLKRLSPPPPKGVNEGVLAEYTSSNITSSLTGLVM